MGNLYSWFGWSSHFHDFKDWQKVMRGKSIHWYKDEIKGNKKYLPGILFIILTVSVLLSSTMVIYPSIVVKAQQPTGSIPTVTGTPPGPIVTVYTDQNIIGVFDGPSSYLYEQIGILVSGESAPALAYSVEGDWIQIIYMGVEGGKGWVYAPYVSISPGALPKVANPPTSTPRTTPTLDPTYVAAFGVQLEPTHLPTFTQPQPLKFPTYTPSTMGNSSSPAGLYILGLIIIGLLGALITLIRGNR
jgi:hypothetical protein